MATNVAAKVREWLAGQEPGYEFELEEVFQGVGGLNRNAVSAALSKQTALGGIEAIAAVGATGYRYRFSEVVNPKYVYKEAPEGVMRPRLGGYESPRHYQFDRGQPKGLIEAIADVVEASRPAPVEGAEPPRLSLAERLLELAVEVEAMELKMARMEAAQS